MPLEDQEIIHKILEGNDSIFAELVRKYQARIITLCTSMLSDAKEAEDAAQEVFVKAFYALHNFQGRSSFYTWLYRIASNRCLDLMRKKYRYKTQSWDELLEQKGDEIERLLAKNESPESSRDNELVHEALSHLKPEWRLILTLREIQGLSYEEIAETLGCSLDAVKSRLQRSRRDLKEKLRHFLKP